MVIVVAVAVSDPHLNPCPRCGGQAHYAPEHLLLDGTRYIKCWSCPIILDISKGKATYKLSPSYDAKKQLAEIWNCTKTSDEIVNT